ncbi:MAG: hypothetical protein E5V22_11115, partial [Mesorhizobium sp.]
MTKIRVDVSSSRPLFIEVDPDSFGALFASMGDDDQVAVLRAMVSHMLPHRQQWDHISIALEAAENRDVRDQLREVLFPPAEGAALLAFAKLGLTHLESEWIKIINNRPGLSDAGLARLQK